MHDGLLVDVLYGGQDALRKLLFGSDLDVSEHGARQLGEEALLSQEPCLGVKVNSKRPSSWVVSQALVSFEVWAEWLSRIILIAVEAG
jgi:hypothetical protein